MVTFFATYYIISVIVSIFLFVFIKQYFGGKRGTGILDVTERDLTHEL
tara:strand:- start:368 stop:511 length:144 start_codon:yes stop_codon:yes gene_type:complete